jgi:uncharacterized protein
MLSLTITMLGLLWAAPTAAAKPIECLIITGDHGHDWKATTAALEEFLPEGGKIKVTTTTSPAKDLTPENLAKYDVLLFNYKDTKNGSEESRWSDANKAAFLEAVKSGKGLVVLHHASSAFVDPNWDEFEKATAGGWRKQGFHGPKLVFTVKKTAVDHPITAGLKDSFEHTIDELYQNSMITPGSVVIATAFSPADKPRGTGKDEAMVWVNKYGEGRVVQNAMGHDVEAMSDPMFRELMRRCVEWAATGKVEATKPK